MVRLVEYQTSEVSLDRAERNYLLDVVKGTGSGDGPKVIESLTPTKQDGVYAIRPGPFVGRLGLPSGRWLDIDSRFAFDDVIELIRHSGRAPLHVDRLRVPGQRESFVIDVLAAAFVREVDLLIGAGLAKGYRLRRFERPPYPGQIDVNRHISRYAARPDVLVTTAKRITHDIAENRALALSADLLLRVPLDRSIAHGVRALVPAFARVRRLPMSASRIAQIPLTRLTSRYEPALQLAEIILGGSAVAPRGSSRSGASILFNMPKVWESFVAKWAAATWGPSTTIKAGYTFDFSDGGELRSEADVTVWREDELIALYDAKYKWPGKGPSMGDVYQMVSYCSRLGIGEATLVYAGAGSSRRYRIGPVVHTKSLPMSALAEATPSASVRA